MLAISTDIYSTILTFDSLTFNDDVAMYMYFDIFDEICAQKYVTIAASSLKIRESIY